MNNRSESNPSRWPLARILKWGGIALVILPFTIFLGWRGAVTMDIKRLEQIARDRGEPLTMLDYDDYLPDVADDENAALAILDILEVEEGPFWSEWRTTGKTVSPKYVTTNDPALPFIGEGQTSLPWPEPQLRAVRAFGESRKERNAKMKAALAHPRSKYPVNYVDGFNTLLPHLATVKSETAKYQVENFLAIQEGRIEDSIETIEQMARMANTLKDEPFLISQLVCIACRKITMNGMEQLISWKQLNREQLKQLESVLEGFAITDELYRSLLTERAAGLSVFSMSSVEVDAIGGGSAGGSNLASGAIVGLMKITGLSSIDKRLMLETYDAVLVLSTNLTPANQSAIGDTMDKAVQEASAFPPKLFTRLLLPALSNVSRKFLRLETERELLLIALAIEAYQLNNDGLYPESLSQLKAAGFDGELSDPFDGRELRYQQNTNQYIIYSVGLDEVDNQGQKQNVGKQEDYSVIITHHTE